MMEVIVNVVLIVEIAGNRLSRQTLKDLENLQDLKNKPLFQ